MSSYYCPVYKLRFSLAMPDRDMPQPRYHTTIFVETNQTDQSGFEHHVTGDITSSQGMLYERKPSSRPGASGTFYDKEFLGYTLASYYPTAFDKVLSTVPAPAQQKAFNIATMRTEPFKTLNPLTFYEPGEARQPLIKCTEWTNDRALPALRAANLIVTQLPSSTGSQGFETATAETDSSGQAASGHEAGNNDLGAG